MVFYNQPKATALDGGSSKTNKKPQPLTEAQRKRYQEKTDRILKERDNFEACYGKTPDAMQLLQEQEEKQKRIREYKNLINDVTKTSSDIAKYCEELKEIEESINANFRGNQAKELMGLVTQAYSQCETVIGSLNAIGSKAASQIRANGEGSYTYNDVKLQKEDSDKKYKRNI